MEMKNIKVIDFITYRSKPLINMQDDMVKVELKFSKKENMKLYRQLKVIYENTKREV